MGDALESYKGLTNQLASQAGVTSGQMFGKPCLKVNGKAFVAQHLDTVVFKVSGTPRENAMSLPGAILWDPSGKGRPMKEWVAIPSNQSASFGPLAKAALEYVKSVG